MWINCGNRVENYPGQKLSTFAVSYQQLIKKLSTATVRVTVRFTNHLRSYPHYPHSYYYYSYQITFKE